MGEIEIVEGGYAPGSQKLEIEGRVLRWHHERGAEAVPALQYIEAFGGRELGRLKSNISSSSSTAASAAVFCCYCCCKWSVYE